MPGKGGVAKALLTSRLSFWGSNRVKIGQKRISQRDYSLAYLKERQDILNRRGYDS